MKTKKTLTEKLLERFAIKFVEDHFSEIDFNKVGWEVLNLEDAIKQIKNDSELADYIISEVMDWGTPVNYLKKVTVGWNNGEIVKINNKYFCFSNKAPYEVKQKITKEIIYVRK